MMNRWLLLGCAAALVACGSDDPVVNEDPGPVALVDLSADLSAPEHFYDFPYPSDLRLTADGAPDLRGMPHASGATFFGSWTSLAMERKGYNTNPVAYFRFAKPLAPIAVTEAFGGDSTSAILIIDVDPASPERGRLIPAVAQTLTPDDYVPENLLGVVPRPGFVLHESRKYAVVVRTSLKDATGASVAVSPEIAAIRSGKAAGARGADAVKLYASLWETLESAGIDASTVATATVFTTGDVVADTQALSDKVLAKYAVTIDDLHIDPDDGLAHDRYCELIGTVDYPQFQRGTPPFNADGLFEIGDDGLPVKQRVEKAPITIVIPKQPMPAGGYPLMIYFHGSGGVSGAVVDRGRWVDEETGNTLGEGPGYVVAPFNIASAGSALPVNPERLPGASETAYLNLVNVPAMRDTFRQGIIEQRLFLKALESLKISPETLGACTGPSLPSGETAYRFDPDQLVASGQSMGGMYTNLISAVEPRIRAAVPTGAGGYWTYYVLQTTVMKNVPSLLAAILRTEAEVSYLHPALGALETGLEAADPYVYMPRLAKRPLPGSPVRPIYETTSIGDSYFPTPIYDAMSLSYGHKQVGEVVWPGMQELLTLGGLGGLVPYPANQTVKSDDGVEYTGVVVQYEGDGIYDPHAIYSQLDEVKYQYGCFFSTFLHTGIATVPAPAPLGTPCPGMIYPLTRGN